MHYDETRAVEPLERTATWEAGEVPEKYPSMLLRIHWEVVGGTHPWDVSADPMEPQPSIRRRDGVRAALGHFVEAGRLFSGIPWCACLCTFVSLRSPFRLSGFFVEPNRLGTSHYWTCRYLIEKYYQVFRARSGGGWDQQGLVAVFSRFGSNLPRCDYVATGQ